VQRGKGGGGTREGENAGVGERGKGRNRGGGETVAWGSRSARVHAGSNRCVSKAGFTMEIHAHAHLCPRGKSLANGVSAQLVRPLGMDQVEHGIILREISRSTEVDW